MCKVLLCHRGTYLCDNNCLCVLIIVLQNPNGEWPVLLAAATGQVEIIEYLHEVCVGVFLI